MVSRLTRYNEILLCIVDNASISSRNRKLVVIKMMILKTQQYVVKCEKRIFLDVNKYKNSLVGLVFWEWYNIPCSVRLFHLIMLAQTNPYLI